MKLLKNTVILFFVSMMTLLLAACTTAPTKTSKDGAPGYYVNPNKLKEPVPTKLPLNKQANKPTYSVRGHTYHVLKTYKGYQATGTASWYGTKFNGHLTSNGEHYNMLQMTAASKELPIPCFAKVTNLQTGKSVIVKVNDRGPFEKGRLLDVSYAAALKLGMVGRGTAKVHVTAIDPDTYNRSNHLAKGQSVYIKAATVRNKAHATALANQLKRELHTPVAVYASNSGKHSVYQVKAGPIYDSQTADNLVGKMQQDGIANPVTVTG